MKSKSTKPREALDLLTTFVLAAVLLTTLKVEATGGTAGSPSSASESGTVQSGEFSLQYRIEGKGLPAIVIGFPNYYSRVFSENLRSHFQFVFVDHRGTALSPGTVDTGEFALDRIVDDVELVRKALDLERIVIIGHSGHSFMALEYAKKYPKNVSHVIMIGIAPDLSESSSEAAERNWIKLASSERKSVLERNREKMPDEELAKLSPGDRWIKNYVRNGPMAWFDAHFDSTPLWKDVDVNMDMLGYVWGEVFRDIDITTGLDSFDRPVFLALGRYDFLVAPPSSWETVKDQFKDLTVEIFEKSGHTPQYEESEQFDRKLIAWVQAHE